MLADIEILEFALFLAQFFTVFDPKSFQDRFPGGIKDNGGRANRAKEGSPPHLVATGN
jgi:hypothetical protein